MSGGNQPSKPSLPWRVTSSITMGLAGMVSKGFLFGCNRTEVHGLEKFVKTLDERKDVDGRERGLLTVSNHISVVDDPLIWGTLPARHLFNPPNMRWSLGSYDICFKNKALSTFFTIGQVLPTHRTRHSPLHGGLFQPTLTQCIRILSSSPHNPLPAASKPSLSVSSPDLSDPFTSANLTYTTNGEDTFPAPSAYPRHRNAWIHVFPEGKVHQHPLRTMRYFKWGLSRMILESDPAPRVVPIWIEGLDEVMHEAREWPRFIPRVGKQIKVVFGEEVDDEVFAPLRERWQRLVRKEAPEGVAEMGILPKGGLRDGEEARELRRECARRVREEVMKVRRGMGWPDEDPRNGLAETWIEADGEGKMTDGSWEKDT